MIGFFSVVLEYNFLQIHKGVAYEMKDYMNKIPKETLTVQNIRDELKQTYKKSFWVVLVFVISAIIFLIVAINIEFEHDPSFYLMWFVAITFLVCTAIVVAIYVKQMVQLKQKITIVTDWLVDIREDVDLRHGRYHRNRQVTVLTFAKYGQFKLFTDIYGDINYTWSKMYAMSNQGVCNYSNIDDEFYLVITNDKNPRILQIYNQKLFELK